MALHMNSVGIPERFRSNTGRSRKIRGWGDLGWFRAIWGLKRLLQKLPNRIELCVHRASRHDYKMNSHTIYVIIHDYVILIWYYFDSYLCHPRPESKLVLCMLTSENNLCNVTLM